MPESIAELTPCPETSAHQDPQPRVVEAIEIVNVAPKLVGGRVADRDPQDSARLGGPGHQGVLDLARQVELEVQLLVRRLELAIALDHFLLEVGGP